MKKFQLRVDKKCKLSEFILKNFSDINYNIFQKILRKEDIKINREKTTKNINLEKGDFVEFFYEEKPIKYFETIYEDENIIVVNKSFGIIVSKEDKTKPHEKTLQELIEKELKQEVISLHRIDMNTCGLVVFCKNKKVFNELKNAMIYHEVEKFYMGEVVGKYNLQNAEHSAFLTKNKFISKVCVTKRKEEMKAMPIKTYVELVEVRNKTSILNIKISNGKTHQIRAHLAFLGFPLVGDNKYGEKEANKDFGTRMQKLLAYKIVFTIKTPTLKYLNNESIELSKETITKFFA